MTTAGASPASTPELRPLGIGELLDVAIRICLRHWRPLVTAVAVVVVPVQIISTIVTASTLPDDAESFLAPPADPAQPPTFEFTDDLAAFVGGQVVVVLLALVMAVLATAACFKAVADAYLGAQPDWRGSLRLALKLLLPLLLVTLLNALGIGFGLILLIIPGIWLWIAWSLAVPALVTEDVRGRKALARSFRLVRGRWWPTFGAILIGFILTGIVSFVFGALLGGVLGFSGTQDDVLANLIVNGIAGTVGALIATPFQAAVVALVYFDLRVRKEGFDLELLAQRIGTPPEARSAGPAAPAFAPRAGAPSPAPSAGDGSAPAAGSGEQPPFYPPPPGWRPSSGSSADE